MGGRTGPRRACWNLSPCAYFSAPSPQHRILLDFLFLDTECTYDYLFVYDGDSPQGPLLASLSGSTRPPPIEASSGKVSGGNTGSLGNMRERRSTHLGRLGKDQKDKSQSEDIREDTVEGGKRQNALGLVVHSCDLCVYEAEAEGLLRV